MKYVSVRLGSSLRKITAGILAFAFIAAGAAPAAASAATGTQAGQEQAIYEQASKEFQVPQDILMAVSYYQSRWEDHGSEMSVDGGFGPMNLRTAVPVRDGRGDPSRAVAPGKLVAPKTDMTLDKAARLLDAPAASLKKDVALNIRGGAALLADKAKQLNSGKLPTDQEDWYAVAATYLGGENPQNIRLFTDQLQDLLKTGKAATTSKGQQLQLSAKPQATLDQSKLQAKLKALGLKSTDAERSNNGAECPRTITCRFIPAGYAANSDDPADYGNYDHANRPHDMKVDYIIIHDTEGSYTSSIQWFQNTQSYVSAHYVIRSSDGEVTQMVPTSSVAWHAGDWYVNMHSIGIEHEGFAAEGASWYTEAMYQSSANLVRYLAKKYDIPLDRDHILGHDNVPGLTDARVPTMHWDPGPYWDWGHYMDLIKGKKADAADVLNVTKGKPNAVTISPVFSQNTQTVNNCTDPSDPATCQDLTGPSNFVYLRTAPRADAPLVGDPLLHPGGEAGTTGIADWTAKATAGQQYALAEQQGDWTAVWFANQKAWFYNPPNQPTAKLVRKATVKLKPGLASTHVYGGAYPEASVYPASVPGPAQPQLSYQISQGQQYVSDGVVPTDYFYDATIDYSRPHDHEVFRGEDKYLKIWYNQRVMFVKKADVVIEK